MSDIAALGTIEHIDPTQIEVETNIRTTVKLDGAFLASIRDEPFDSNADDSHGDEPTLLPRNGQRTAD